MNGVALSRRVLLLGLACLALAAAAQPIVVRDDRGTEHRFAAPPQRIVSMLPSLTEAAWVLGAGTRLVGVDRHGCHAQPGQHLHQLPGPVDPNPDPLGEHAGFVPKWSVWNAQLGA